jgi:plasmid stability protein
MKNITLKIDDEIYRRARIRASQDGTSVSAMVRNFLESLEKQKADEEEAERTRIKRLLELYAEADARANNSPPREPWVFNREECYEERLR